MPIRGVCVPPLTIHQRLRTERKPLINDVHNDKFLLRNIRNLYRKAIV